MMFISKCITATPTIMLQNKTSSPLSMMFLIHIKIYTKTSIKSDIVFSGYFYA